MKVRVSECVLMRRRKEMEKGDSKSERTLESVELIYLHSPSCHLCVCT